MGKAQQLPSDTVPDTPVEQFYEISVSDIVDRRVSASEEFGERFPTMRDQPLERFVVRAPEIIAEGSKTERGLLAPPLPRTTETTRRDAKFVTRQAPPELAVTVTSELQPITPVARPHSPVPIPVSRDRTPWPLPSATHGGVLRPRRITREHLQGGVVATALILLGITFWVVFGQRGFRHENSQTVQQHQHTPSARPRPLVLHGDQVDHSNPYGQSEGNDKAP